MKSNKLLLSVLVLALMTGCSGGSSDSSTPTITLLAVTPANPTIIVGSTIQLTATGTFSDNTVQDLTAQASWSSSSQSVATISNAASSNGLVASLAPGTTTITATWGGASGSTLLTVNSAPSGNNVLTLTVNGSNCSDSYQNKPCVSVTVCSPGTSNCDTINDILLDTGSTGLRIFKSLLTVSLNQVSSGSGSLAECIQYLDGSSDWGPVQTADVILGNERTVLPVPIQVIDSTFGTVPSSCGIPDTDLTKKFNGILGVSLFAEDCGPTCTTNANVGRYYVCSGPTCTRTIAPLTSQVQNPVALLPVDNNGVILELPSISLGGTPSVTGYLVLGIGTQANNTPSGVTTYAASSTGEFTTVFNGSTYNHSFIDSGSNALYFPAPSTVLQVCTGPYTDWYCPSSTTSLTATTTGFSGSPSNTVSFEIGNAVSLFNSGNRVFSELGGSTGSPPSLFFDWGLPFFLGRNVYVGIEGKTSSLGTGPYWAY